MVTMKCSIKSLKDTLQSVLMTLPFLPFDLILLASPLRTLQKGLILFLIPIIIIKTLQKKYICDPFYIIVALYLFSVAPFSLVEHNIVLGSVLRYYGRMLGVLAYCFLTVILIKKNANVYFRTMAFLFSLLIVMNFLTVLLFPNGLYTIIEKGTPNKCWLLGYDNGHVVYQIYGIMMVMINSLIKRGSILRPLPIGLYFISLFSTVKLWSTTALVALIAFGFIFVLAFAKELRKLCNGRLFTVLVAAIFFLIMSIVLGGRIGSTISWIVVSILKKDITFTARKQIWIVFLSNIKSVIYGNGFESIEILTKRFYINSAHNQWIQMFYEGGIIHVGIYLLMLYMYAKEISKRPKNMIKSVVAISVFSIMIVQLMRTCFDEFWLSMLVIAHVVSCIDETKYHRKKQEIVMMKEFSFEVMEKNAFV